MLQKEQQQRSMQSSHGKWMMQEALLQRPIQ
jgi:hypothetical protein